MEFTIDEDYRIITKPFNWVIQKKHKDKWQSQYYYDKLDQAKKALISLGFETKTVFTLGEKIKTILNIDDSQTSALFLTRMKHPHFIKRMNPNSLVNLQNEAHTSTMMKRARSLAREEAKKAKDGF